MILFLFLSKCTETTISKNIAINYLFPNLEASLLKNDVLLWCRMLEVDSFSESCDGAVDI